MNRSSFNILIRTHLSGHLKETKAAPKEMALSSSPLLFLMVYLITSSPDSVFPNASSMTPIAPRQCSASSNTTHVWAFAWYVYTIQSEAIKICLFLEWDHIHGTCHAAFFTAKSAQDLVFQGSRIYGSFNETIKPTASEMTEKSRIVNQWCVYFDKGRDFDSWGQLVEAAEEYSRCVLV